MNVKREGEKWVLTTASLFHGAFKEATKKSNF
jgi:hypothetical protein